MKTRYAGRRYAAVPFAMLLLAYVNTVRAEILTLAVARGTVSLPVYVAQANGYFEAEGLNVRLAECTSGRHCLELVKQGKAHVATAAELAVVLANRSGDRFAIVTAISSTSHQIKLIGRRSAGIEHAENLRGKLVATVPGTSAQYFLASWLLYFGMPMSSVRHKALDPDRSVETLKSGNVDAIAVWEPHASRALKALSDDAIELPNPRIYTQHFVLALQRSDLLRRTDALPRLLNALAKAQRAIAEQPAKARHTLAARLSLSEEEVAAALQKHDFRLRLDQAMVNTMSQQVRWAQQEDIGDVMDSMENNPLSWIDASWLQRTVPGSSSLPAR